MEFTAGNLQAEIPRKLYTIAAPMVFNGAAGEVRIPLRTG